MSRVSELLERLGERNPLDSIRKYDKESDSWYAEIKKLLKFKGTLKQLYDVIYYFDPDGYFDSGMSSKDFVKRIKTYKSSKADKARKELNKWVK